ncbi:MAG: LysM peptidoglycan-binding domain-containing protein [Bacilli bacterium]|nr:LysM peptidoglycan-binding domain-containing protein [Bacilli bacterium]MBR2997487.1 LysM peptidoglycan-binding domain-containing protein [Bacilli bacterium]
MSKFGIDISTWQDGLDYSLASNQGVKFAILRAGFSDTKDNRFEEHYENAINQGWDIGAYWYSYASNKEEAINEANTFLNVIKGKKFTYPIYLDIEDPSMSYLGRDTLNEIVDTFGSIIENAGYYFGVYSNLNWYRNIISGKELNSKYDWWIACWSDSSPNNVDYGIWQNTSSYVIGNQNVDSDYCYKDYPTIIRENNLNHLDNTEPVIPDIKPNVYIVKAGDTLSGIAEMYNTTYQELARYNNISDPDLIYPGEEIRIPTNNTSSSTIIYTVKPGDTLSEIAEMYNTTYQELARINNISDPDLIYPGEEIRIN